MDIYPVSLEADVSRTHFCGVLSTNSLFYRIHFTWTAREKRSSDVPHFGSDNLLICSCSYVI